MSHIPHHLILPQDMVDMHDHGHEQPIAHRMHISDAKHAMDVDPERWTLAGDLPPHKKVKTESPKAGSPKRKSDDV